MRAAIVKWAKAQDLPQTEKAVLRALADYYSPRWGRSEPSQSKIAKDIGVTRETVNRVLSRLIERGLIARDTAPRKKGQWERRVYTLLIGGEAGRVTEDHTAPCDFNQTRHRVTQEHTSRKGITPAKGETFGGGRASA